MSIFANRISNRSIDRTLVFTIRSNRGVRIKATSDVEKSVSTSDMSSSYDWFEGSKGSVVYMRKPLVVATG